jgi:hypothetical protein
MKWFDVILTVLLAVLTFPGRMLEKMVNVWAMPPQVETHAMSAPGGRNVKGVTIGTPVDGGSGAFTVALQLTGENAKDLTAVGVVFFYLSTDAAGMTLAANTTDLTALAIGTDGTIIEWGTNVSGVLISESDGDIDLALTIVNTKTVYLQVILPDGTLSTSAAMTYS